MIGDGIVDVPVRGLSLQRNCNLCVCVAEPCLGWRWRSWDCCEVESTREQDALLIKSQVQTATRPKILEVQKNLVN